MDTKNTEEIVQKVIDSIESRRKQVLGHFDRFQECAAHKRKKLVQSCQFQLFRRNAKELEEWLLDKSNVADEFRHRDSANIQSKIQKYTSFVEEVLAHGNTVYSVKDLGLTMVNDGHFSSSEIKNRVEELLRMWNELLAKLEEKKQKMELEAKLREFYRECDEILRWIKKKSSVSLELAQNSGASEDISVTYEKFLKELRRQEFSISNIRFKATDLDVLSLSESDDTRQKYEEVLREWENLRSSVASHLEGFDEKQNRARWGCEADDLIAWIEEKTELFSQAVVIPDGASGIDDLRKKLNLIERELEVIGEGVNRLKKGNVPSNVENIQQETDQDRKMNKVQQRWKTLVEKALVQKREIERVCEFERFCLDHRDLMSWIAEMEAILASDLPTNDFADAEELISMAEEYRGEINARKPLFEVLEMTANDLTQKDIFDEQVETMLFEMLEARSRLETAWEEKLKSIEFASDENLLRADELQIEVCMTTQEKYLAGNEIGASLDEVEQLVRIHEDFEKNITAHEEKVNEVCSFADSLLQKNHPNSENISQRLNVLKSRREKIMEKSKLRRDVLQESLKSWLFNSDCDEMMNYIHSKLDILKNMAYLKSTNVHSEEQKHKNFELELKANENRLEHLKKQLDAILNVEKADVNTSRNSDQIELRVCELNDLWEVLCQESYKKHTRLENMQLEIHFDKKTNDLEIWIENIENKLSSTDYGNDVRSVRRLQTELRILESDYYTRVDSLHEIDNMIQRFRSDGECSTDAVCERNKVLRTRFENIEVGIRDRRDKLMQSLMEHEKSSEVNDELDWIREKMNTLSQLVAQKATNVQIIKNRLLKLQAEISSHEANVENLMKDIEEVVTEKQSFTTKLATKREELFESWQKLKKGSEETGALINDRLLAFNCLMIASDSETWIDEKLNWLNIELKSKQKHDFETFIKKLRLLALDVKAFESTVCDLNEKSNELSLYERAGEVHEAVKVVNEKYNHLKELIDVKQRESGSAMKADEVREEIFNVHQWIDKQTEALHSDAYRRYDDIEDVQDNLVLLRKEIEKKKTRIIDTAHDLSKGAVKKGSRSDVSHEVEDLFTRLHDISKLISKEEENVRCALEVRQFDRENAETIDWIIQKDAELGSDSDLLSNELRSVVKIQGRIDGIACDVEALEKRVSDLSHKANELRKKHPELAHHVYELQSELDDRWNQLLDKVSNRKKSASDAVNYHRLISDARELERWISDMHPLVTSKQLADDLVGVQVLLEQHQEYRNEIDGRAPCQHALKKFGDELIGNAHPASDKIMKLLKKINNASLLLDQDWQLRKDLLESCLDLQFFKKDCDEVLSWLKVREEMLDRRNIADNEAESWTKRLEEVEVAIAEQREKIDIIEKAATDMKDSGHYASDEAMRRRDEVVDAWIRVDAALDVVRTDLNGSQAMRMWAHDVHQLETWLDQKIQLTDEERYRQWENEEDQQKWQKSLEEELSVYEDKISNLSCAGGVILEEEDEMKQRIEKLNRKMRELVANARERSQKLKEEAEEKKLTELAEDAEQWLVDLRLRLQSIDVVANASVENSLRRQQLLEAEMISREEDATILHARAARHFNNNLFNHPLGKKIESIIDEFGELKQQAAEKRDMLSKAQIIHHLIKDLDDEESWIKEKLLLICSDDYGRDLNGVRNLCRKHRRTEVELDNHETQITKLCRRAMEQTVIASQVGVSAEKICGKTETLKSRWHELKTTCNERQIRLAESEKYHSFAEDVAEEDAWLRGQLQVLESNDDVGKTLTAVQREKKKNDEIRADLKQHSVVVEKLIGRGNKLLHSGTYNERKIEQKCERLRETVEEILHKTETERDDIDRRLALLKFAWKCDGANGCLDEIERELNSLRMRSRDSASVKVFRNKIDTVRNGLNAFERDSLAKLKTMQRDLIDQPNSKEVLEKVIDRYSNCISTCDKFYQQIASSEHESARIEDLLLEFARCASKLNSWMEGVEEDLTDAVHCQSLQHVVALFNAHINLERDVKNAGEQLVHLSNIRDELKMLSAGSNPYTWHTVASLEASWQELLALMAERKEELAREERRQQQNEVLCRDVASATDGMITWLHQLRQQLIATSQLPLDQQLSAVRDIQSTMRERMHEMADLEAKALALEKKLVFDNRHTKHSAMTVKQTWEQVEQLSSRMLFNVETQLHATLQCGVPEKTLREFVAIFNHFDTEKKGALSLEQYKCCLHALGYEDTSDVGAEETAKRLFSEASGGASTVSLSGYMQQLIARETEHVVTGQQISDAFRSLAKKNSSYVTKDELFANLTPEQVAFCVDAMPNYVDPQTGQNIRHAYDFNKFSSSLF